MKLLEILFPIFFTKIEDKCYHQWGDKPKTEIGYLKMGAPIMFDFPIPCDVWTCKKCGKKTTIKPTT